MKRKASSSAGFTLIELMITVAIIGILASIATPLFLKYTYKARTAEASTNLGGIRTSMLAYFTSEDMYLNITTEPPVVGRATGLKKSWPQLPQIANARITGSGTFSNIGYEPAGQVYYHYVCRTTATFLGAVLCEAASDLDGNTIPGIYQIAWRVDPGNPMPPSTTGQTPSVLEWGTLTYRTPGAF
jgi:prepilin-type N-terminal cleavage/methylation domain-containing protein